MLSFRLEFFIANYIKSYFFKHKLVNFFIIILDTFKVIQGPNWTQMYFLCPPMSLFVCSSTSMGFSSAAGHYPTQKEEEEEWVELYVLIILCDNLLNNRNLWMFFLGKVFLNNHRNLLLLSDFNNCFFPYNLNCWSARMLLMVISIPETIIYLSFFYW
jgi:hypothetical protein